MSGQIIVIFIFEKVLSLWTGDLSKEEIQEKKTIVTIHPSIATRTIVYFLLTTVTEAISKSSLSIL